MLDERSAQVLQRPKLELARLRRFGPGGGAGHQHGDQDRQTQEDEQDDHVVAARDHERSVRLQEEEVEREEGNDRCGDPRAETSDRARDDHERQEPECRVQRGAAAARRQERRHEQADADRCPVHTRPACASAYAQRPPGAAHPCPSLLGFEPIPHAGLGDEVTRPRGIRLELPPDLRHVDPQVVGLLVVLADPTPPASSCR